MKKSLILLTIPTLLLASCNKEVDEAEAKRLAKGIAEHDVQLSDFKSARFEQNLKYSRKGKVDAADINDSSFEKTIKEINVEKYYFHSVYETDNTKHETWAFVRDDKLTVASYDKQGSGDATKNKYEISIGVKIAFETKTAAESAYILGKVSAKSYAEMVVDSSILPAGAEAKYYSSGDGNLTVEATVKYENVAKYDYKATGKDVYKLVLDQYLLAEYSQKQEANYKSDDGASDFNETVEEVEKVSINSVSPSYPNLSEYKTVLEFNL